MSFIWVFPLVILSIIGVFVGLWIWTQFLETGKPATIRSCLFLFLLIVMFIQFYIWTRGTYYYDYIFPIMILCDIFGMLDAILRYPVVHDLDSLFSLKQLLLIGIKTCLHALGWRNVGKTATLFLGMICICCWLIPLCYLMALPIGDTRSQIGKSDVRDLDISFKIYYVLGSFIFGAGKGPNRHPHQNKVGSMSGSSSSAMMNFQLGLEIREEIWESVRINMAWLAQWTADNVPKTGKVLVEMGMVDKRTQVRRSNKEI